MIRILSLFLALVAALSGMAAPAAAADLVAVDVSRPGACANSSVLHRIRHRFDHQVRNVPHLPNVAIEDFYRIRETRHVPQRANRPVDRRYCNATVALSNGASRTVWYFIERPMGFAGIGSNVEFCVSGFDRWHVYGGRCRTAR